MVETEGTHTAGFIGSDFEKNLIAQTPLGRIGQPDDIAAVAVFLASDDSGWLTGECIRERRPVIPVTEARPGWQSAARALLSLARQ